MVLVAFTWQEPARYKLQLIQFREYRDNNGAFWWVTEEETKDILGVRNRETGGTLLGCTKRGRVAILVHANPFGNDQAEMLPVEFLKGKMSPRDFAEQLRSDTNLSWGLNFYLVVADIPSKSMFYISKRSPSNGIDDIRPVDSGFHFINAATGLDSTSPRDLLLKDKFGRIFAAYEAAGYTLEILKHKFNYFQIEGEEGEEAYYGLTLLEVKDTGKVTFMKNEGDTYDPYDHFYFDMEY